MLILTDQIFQIYFLCIWIGCNRFSFLVSDRFDKIGVEFSNFGQIRFVHFDKKADQFETITIYLYNDQI